MGLLDTLTLAFELTPASFALVVFGTILIALALRIVYCQYFHPLSKFPGPWYATSFSIVLAIISLRYKEPEYLSYLVKKYGTDRPIRISPTLLMFPRPSAAKDIYWDPKCNLKSGLYGTGALGPPSLVSTLDGEQHKQLRKALSNAPWTIGQLKKTWEPRFDDQIQLFVSKMREHSKAGRVVCLSDKVAEFAADIMSMISFTNAFGCVQNQRDEKLILTNWRIGLDFFGFASRFRFFRETILPMPCVGRYFLPTVDNEVGMGWLMCEADQQVTAREKQIAEKGFERAPDFLQHCLEARYSDGTPLTPVQKRAHVTLLIQAGADTTATALGSTLRFMTSDPKVFARARAEIDAADRLGYLSTPILYEETRRHLPYFVACIKESLRLNPSAPQLLSRVTPKGGKVVEGHYVPEGMEVTSHAYTMQRDRETYGEDADAYRPERWLESEQRTSELDAAQFVFGMGPRVCLGKDIAIMEMFKLLPEIVRRFDIEVVQKGKYVVAGGVAYNKGFMGRFIERDGQKSNSPSG